MIVEGAGVVGVGALLSRKIDVKGKKVELLLTGSSIDSEEYIRIIQSRLVKGGTQ